MAVIEEVNDAPLAQEQNILMELTRKVLNPNGDDPRVDQYITSCFSYILGVLYKMSVSNNREETAKEIAQDLNHKFEAWVSEREKAKAEEAAAEANGATDSKIETEKIESEKLD